MTLTQRYATGLQGKYEQRDLWKEYRAHVLKFLKLERPLRVIVDGSNGMAGKMLPAVFGDVKNLTIVPILFEITGSFTHEPNPLVAANLREADLRAADENHRQERDQSWHQSLTVRGA